jgi:F0F1-type ATP synthase gamma subunit
VHLFWGVQCPMMAMAAARTNIDANLEELSRRERKLHRGKIIGELVELTAGTKAIKSSSSVQ